MLGKAWRNHNMCVVSWNNANNENIMEKLNCKKEPMNKNSCFWQKIDL